VQYHINERTATPELLPTHDIARTSFSSLLTIPIKSMHVNDRSNKRVWVQYASCHRVEHSVKYKQLSPTPAPRKLTPLVSSMAQVLFFFQRKPSIRSGSGILKNRPICWNSRTVDTNTPFIGLTKSAKRIIL